MSGASFPARTSSAPLGSSLGSPAPQAAMGPSRPIPGPAGFLGARQGLPSAPPRAGPVPGSVPVTPSHSVHQHHHHHHLHHQHHQHHHHHHLHHQHGGTVRVGGVPGAPPMLPPSFMSRVSDPPPTVSPAAQSPVTNAPVGSMPSGGAAPSTGSTGTSKPQSPTTSGAPNLPSSSTPSAAAAAAAEEDIPPALEFPANRVYDRRVMLRLRDCKSDLPESIRRFGMTLWGKVSADISVVERPQHMQITRDDLFSGSAAAAQSKIVKERKLHHEVLGILARVTPEKYEKLREELLALPIRQSDDRDIQLVVETFFQKSIRPEDSLYAEYYVKLIADMITFIGCRTKDDTGQKIRKEIVTQCQKTFQSSDALTDPESLNKEGMDPEDFEQQRSYAKKKNKANINFLGLLFLNGLVNEKVVTNVLFYLLYGPSQDDEREPRRRRNRHAPADFEVEMFLELLLKVGKKITESTAKYMPNFIETMRSLSQSHPSKRIQFLLLDALEVIHNDFEPKKAKGPKKIQDFEESLHRQKELLRESVDQALVGAGRGGAGAGGVGMMMMPNAVTVGRVGVSPTSKPSAPTGPPPKPLPSVRDVTEALDSYGDQGISLAASLLKELPDRSQRVAYITKWLWRPMTVLKLSDIRSKIGETLKALVEEKAVSVDEARQAVQAHLREIVEKGEYEDQPKYYANWAAVVRQGEGVVTSDLHTLFLKMVVEDEKSTVDAVRKLIHDVQQQPTNEQSDHAAARRFRLLPSLLLHRPALDRCGEDTYDPEEDVLQNVADLEVSFFLSLFNEEALPDLLQSIGKNPDRGTLGYTTKIVCATFCFARFDVGYVCAQRGLKEILKKLLLSWIPQGPFRLQSELAWLGEIFATWKELDRIPCDGFTAFVRWMVDQQLITPTAVSQFVTEVLKLGRELDSDAQVLRLLLVAPAPNAAAAATASTK